MPFNGSGSFSPYTPGNPAVSGTTISSTAFNNTVTDFAAGLSNAMTRDGQSPATANIPMGGKKITGLGDGSAATDAATVGQTATALAASSGSSLVGYLPSGTGAVVSTVQTKLRESVSVKDFGAVGDGVTDDYAAIMAAINSAAYGTGYYISAPAVYFPPGTYKVNTTIQLKKAVRLYGDGSGLPYSNAPILKFPAGTTGIIVHRYNTIGITVEGSPTTAGDGSIIEGLNIMGTTGTADSYGGHGIYLRARAKIADCYLQGFKGNGIHIVANAGAGGISEGNANNFYISGGASYLHGGHGLYVDGADANAGTVISFDCSSNTGWGIYDSSFLGNSYVGCHTAGNTLGAYKTDDANAQCVFSGCYSEGGQPASSILPPSISIGGLHGAGFASTSKGVLSGSSIGFRANYLAGASSDASLSVALGAGGTSTEAMNITTSGGMTWRLQYAAGRAYWDWANSGGSEHLTHYDANTVTFSNGYARDLSGAANVYMRPAPAGLPLGYVDKGMLARITLSSVPTSETWLQGDIVYNSLPAASGSIGWVCTTAGTLGTLNGGATTGSITSGTPTLTVSSNTGLKVGQYITIATVSGIYKISAIVGTTVTLTTNASSTAVSQAVAFSNAVFKTFGAISA